MTKRNLVTYALQIGSIYIEELPNSDSHKNKINELFKILIENVGDGKNLVDVYFTKGEIGSRFT